MLDKLVRQQPLQAGPEPVYGTLFTHKMLLHRMNCAVTTHYTVKPRDKDPRWEGIDMER
jgi:hypothetical protein